MVHLENEKFANYIREFGQKRKIVSSEDSDSSKEAPSSENKEDQILVYYRTRGRELPGNYNHALLAELFHSQSTRWGRIARDHVDAVAELVSQFLQAAAKFVIKDNKVHQNVLHSVEKSVQANLQRAIDDLDTLLKDKARQPITYNHYYTDNIQKSRSDQSKRQIHDSMHSTIEQD
ncbi:hypothetical protein CBS147330_9790 [Penicillium roqueforti]|nr:hypothetical protein CBS147330_9790 [Penicillium roqueforti]